MITTEDCQFDKATGEMFLSAHMLGGRFPSEIAIQSAATGRVVNFKPITFDHPRFDEDGWDGEMSLYVPVEKNTKVKLLTVCFEM